MSAIAIALMSAGYLLCVAAAWVLCACASRADDAIDKWNGE